MSGVVVEVPGDSTEDGGEVSVMSASDLTLPDQTSPVPPDSEEGPTEASRDEVVEESPHDGGASSQAQEDINASTVSQLQDGGTGGAKEDVNASATPQLQDEGTGGATAQDQENTTSLPHDIQGKEPPPEDGQASQDDGGTMPLPEAEGGVPSQDDGRATPPPEAEGGVPSQDDGGAIPPPDDRKEDPPSQDADQQANGRAADTASPESQGTSLDPKRPLQNDVVETSQEGSTTQEEEWQDLLGSGQLMKKVIRAGAGTSTRPSQQYRVKVRTRGFLESGQVVDKHSGYWFTVGDGDVVQAWDIGVSLMECGEVVRFKSAPRFAHGERGKGTIPPNATITYEVELLEVLEPVDFGSINEEELGKIVERKKARGNELYQDQDYSKATHLYQKGLQAIQNYLDQHSLTTNIPPSLMEMQVRCLNNIAAAQLKLKQYREALSACERVLAADSDNVKALYRAGRVLSHLGEMDDAVAKLKKALSLLPQDKTIEAELKRTIKKRDQSIEKEKAMYRRMVGTDLKPNESVSPNTPNTWGPWPYMAAAGITAVVAMGLAYFLTQRH